MRQFNQADLAISTMWNFRKALSGRELIDQLLRLGFTSVELNYQVKAEWLPEIEAAITAGELKVVSVHNVFPKTYDERFNTDSMMLGYQDEALRRQAIELSKISIDWACRLGAGAVVLHPTEVPLPPEEFDVPLKALVKAHRTDSDEYRVLRERLLVARESAPYMSAMLRSVGELADYVDKHRLPVKLGIENRAMCHQVPIYDEFLPITERFDGSSVGIWLDTGHGIMMQELGLQALPLPVKVAKSIVGMHIHDAQDGLDHYAPYTLPAPVLEPFLPHIINSPIKVLEMSGRLTAEEIAVGTRRLLKRMNEAVVS